MSFQVPYWAGGKIGGGRAAQGQEHGVMEELSSGKQAEEIRIEEVG